MSSATLPNSLFSEFARNQRLVVGAVITFIHASIISFLILENPRQWHFIVYVSIPALVTVIVPFIITEKVIKWFYTEESLESHLRTLSETTGEIPEAVEVEQTPAILEELPEELEDPDSVKMVTEELLDHVDGEVFDPIDADVRGLIAIGFASSLIIPSALILGTFLGGLATFLVGVAIALLATGIVLKQHRDMIELIEYTPHTIET